MILNEDLSLWRNCSGGANWLTAGRSARALGRGSTDRAFEALDSGGTDGSSCQILSVVGGVPARLVHRQRNRRLVHVQPDVASPQDRGYPP